MAASSEREGAVLDRAAEVGRHRGHHNFTVGQRRGIGVSAPEPLYVIATDADANTVTVGARDELGTHSVRLRDAVLHATATASTRSAFATTPRPCRRGHRRPAPAGTRRSRSSWARSSRRVAGPEAVLLAGEAIVGHGTIAAAA